MHKLCFEGNSQLYATSTQTHCSKIRSKISIKINSNLDEIFIYYLFYDGVSSSHYRASSGRLNQQLIGKRCD